MPIEGYQWNVIVLSYSVATMDLLATVVGITAGVGKESNQLFSWIPSEPLMFVAMFAVNVFVALCLIGYFWHIDKIRPFGTRAFPEIFTVALLAASLVRFCYGPFPWILAITGMM